MNNQIKQLVVALILVLGAAPACAQFSQTYVQKYWIEYLSPEPVTLALQKLLKHSKQHLKTWQTSCNCFTKAAVRL